MESEKKEKKSILPELNRRDFFKISGAATLAVGAASAGIAGYSNAIDRATNTAWETSVGERFDRTPFEIDMPASYSLPAGHRFTHFSWPQTRRSEFAKFINIPPGMPLVDYLRSVVDVNNLGSAPLSIVKDPTLLAYYQEQKTKFGRNCFAEDLRYILEVMPRFQKMQKEAAFDLALPNAYGVAQGIYMAGYQMSHITKTSDFVGMNPKKLEVKDPKEMSNLIKKIGFMFGSPIVRIVELKPEWLFDRYYIDVNGYKHLDPIEYKDHWKYGIIMGAPFSWETVVANPVYGIAQEAYALSSMYAFKMAQFVRQLGYPARENCPSRNYEFAMLPPIVAAGVGERGRNGLCVTPEFGSNFRPCMVATNLPLVPDKPIDIGVKKFCENCKICAESCPSGSISLDRATDITGTGIQGWMVNSSTCHSFWNGTPVATSGCRVCQAVCPFTKKSNWIHTSARDVAIRDKTGLTASVLTWMERNFYGTHDGQYYQYEDGSREYHVVKEIPWFFKTGDFFKES